VYDYAGHRVIFHGGAVQGYRGSIALVPDRDLGVVILWNSTSSVPSGLMPTILDSAFGLQGDWLDLDEDDVDLLYATRKQSRDYGSDASTARAKPR
jgi:beta-lactamase class C